MLPEENLLVPQLSEMLDIDVSETPSFWVFNPALEKHAKYPEPLDNINNFSPEVIYLWSLRAILELEIEMFKEEIATFESVFEDEAGHAKDFLKSMRDTAKEYKEALKETQKELDFVNEKHKEAKDKLKVTNEFANSV